MLILSLEEFTRFSLVSKEKIEEIEKSENLVNSLSDIENRKYTYRLNFNNKNSLNNFKDSLKKEKNIEKVNIVLN